MFDLQAAIHDHVQSGLRGDACSRGADHAELQPERPGADLHRFPVPLMDADHLWLVNIATYGTLAVELALAFLVWVPRLRLYCLAAGVLMHLGIEYGMNIPLFSALMIAGYFPFLTQRDLDGFVALLREDAVWSMPPWRQWYAGRTTIREFMAWVWRPERGGRHRLLPTAANGRPAFGLYKSERHGLGWHAFAIQVLALQDDAIASVTNFVDTRLFTPFGLPRAMPTHSDR